MFNSSGHSFPNGTGTESRQGQGDQMGVARIGENYNYNLSFFETMNNANNTNLGRVGIRNEAGEMRRSVSDDDVDNASDQPPPEWTKKPKKYHRHSPHQIQQLESQCAHPDEKQRLEISRQLKLDPQQVKFWFQNRRTQLKTQQERHENSLLRLENDRLRVENVTYSDGIRVPTCYNCGGSAALPELSPEEQQLRLENARIREELSRMAAVTGGFLGQPTPSLNLGANNLDALALSPVEFGPGHITQLVHQATNSALERSAAYLELAQAAMDELLKMAEADEPIWIRSLYGSGKCVLNKEEYLINFSPPCIGMKPLGFVTEASKETAVVLIDTLSLVDTLMESNKWAEMFPGVIGKATTTDVISDGMGGTRNGALHLMHAELQVVSPLVPLRKVNFLRYCKQLADDVWAVVDVSIHVGLNPSCRRLPSGCIVQDMANGYSKVLWVEHSEYDEVVIHPLYRSMIASGMGFGAQRWISTLHRQCESIVILMTDNHTAAMSPGGRRSMLKLAERMTNNFFAGVCASTVHSWKKLRVESVNELDIRVMTKKSMDDPGEPAGIVVSAATSVWLPVAPHRLFDFLRNERLRSEWDILSNGGPMVEVAHIPRAQDPRNFVSLLRAANVDPNQSNMVILQETRSDASGSVMVYAPVDVPAMEMVMSGGDSAYVALLPSGFAVVPDGPEARGSLLTVGFQILVNSSPTANLTVESVETVNNLISCTVQKIKAAAMYRES